jgi:hypothetical protein
MSAGPKVPGQGCGCLSDQTPRARASFPGIVLARQEAPDVVDFTSQEAFADRPERQHFKKLPLVWFDFFADR